MSFIVRFLREKNHSSFRLITRKMGRGGLIKQQSEWGMGFMGGGRGEGVCVLMRLLVCVCSNRSFLCGCSSSRRCNSTLTARAYHITVWHVILYEEKKVASVWMTHIHALCGCFIRSVVSLHTAYKHPSHIRRVGGWGTGEKLG